MFGYVIPNYDELKIKEFKIYRSFYCGLCKCLKEKFGITGQISLSYEMTFLGILLSSLYDDSEIITSECRCIVHPKKKHMYVKSKYLEYAADMNIIMTYYKCVDDWNDEKKLIKAVYGQIIKNNEKKLKRLYGEKINYITQNLANLYMAEKTGVTSLDEVSGYFGEICKTIFQYGNDEWKDYLGKIGFYLGKFIYLLDAYEDLVQDIEKGCYNPLIGVKEKKMDGFDEYIHNILVMMMSNVSRTFERLPILENAGILKNIVYSGVWQKYYNVVLGEKNKMDSSKWRKI